ncbi:MAG TPA: tyrosine--tRNA ligase [Candidatus Saccharimonadales bacterium]|nr:tyrosine--tRNA ligase [Candidatus Saccharimonadales bacterium]
MKLSEDLQWRNLIKDRTFSDLSWLDTPRTFYLGADCSSADSLTIGNLAVFMLAKRLNKAGWKTVLLVGGATSLIGDPGGKDEERPLKSREEIARNVAGIKAQVQRLFEGEAFTLVDNYEWFKDIGFLEFLRDIGKHYSMTELVQRDYIAERIGERGNGISYAEFSYTLIQGYDFWHLFKELDVEMQIGGSDQWGNMLSGVPLIRKKEQKEAHALSMPLVINKATGKKFGKSEAGAVWLDPERTTPTQFYQFWINLDDEGVEDYIKIYTSLEKAEVDELMAAHHENPRERLAQKKLAGEVTKLLHGAQALAIAEEVTNYLTGKQSVANAGSEALEALKHEIPSVEITVEAELTDVLVQTNLAASKSEARRLLQNNAIAVNGVKVTKEHLDPTDFVQGRAMLRKGKAFKDSALITLAQ